MASLQDSNSTSSRDNALIEVVALDSGGTARNVGSVLRNDGLYGLATDNSTSTIIKDGTNLDAFNRLRVSNPVSLFHSSFEYDLLPTVYSTSTSSGGTVTYDSNKKAAILSTTTTTGSKAIIQAKRYVHYVVGNGCLLILTGNYKGKSTNVVKRFGQFDANNGYYHEVSGTTFSVNIKSKVSGSVVIESASQASWNLDKLDGTGASGITLDPTMQQIFVIDYQWLGAGRVRFGFSINGVITYCHQMSHANLITTLYSQTATLPIRAEIINSGSTAATMEFTCSSIIQEGQPYRRGILRSVSNQATARSIALAGSVVPVLSIRKQSAYVNIPVEILDYGVFSSSVDDLLVRLVINPTITGASWSSVTGYCEIDVSGTAITGGETLYSFYVRGSSASGSTASSGDISSAINCVIGSDVVGVSDILSIVVTTLTSTVTCYSYINYKEIV